MDNTLNRTRKDAKGVCSTPSCPMLSKNEILRDGFPSGGARTVFLNLFFEESNPHQEESNSKKDSQNHYISTNIPKVTHFSIFSSILTVNSKNSVPTPRWNVKSKNSPIVFGAETVAPAKAVIKAAAEKLINNPEKSLKPSS